MHAGSENRFRAQPAPVVRLPEILWQVPRRLHLSHPLMSFEILNLAFVLFGGVPACEGAQVFPFFSLRIYPS